MYKLFTNLLVLNLFSLFHLMEQIGFVCIRKKSKAFKSYSCCEFISCVVGNLI